MQRQHPHLKSGADLQLQTAFQEGNWAVVVRLAEKRARTLGDAYYEIVKICAESQLDDPVARYSAFAAVETYVKDGTVIKDVEGVDLLEWATQGLMGEDDFAHTFGPLRVRTAKAVSNQQSSVIRCLESCLLHWDLASAQQIAAMLDRSFPQARRFMFWNIVITHLLSQSPDTPSEKRKLYGTLAQKQMERAAQQAEQAKGEHASRGVQTEEELLLLYEIVEAHGTAADFDKLVSSPLFSPLAQLRLGRKELVGRVLANFRRETNWRAVFDLCSDCLSHTTEDGQLSTLFADIAVWRQLIEAATNLKAVDPEVSNNVHELLLKFKEASKEAVIYKRNLLLARLAAAFDLTAADDEDLSEGHPHSFRIKEVIRYIDDQHASRSCFDDIRLYIEKLDASAMVFMAFEHLPCLYQSVDEKSIEHARLRLLASKLQYLVLSCPLLYCAVPGRKPEYICERCGKTTPKLPCRQCMDALSEATLSLYMSTAKVDAPEKPSLQSDILIDIALLMAFLQVRALLGSGSQAASLPGDGSARRLLHTLIILEYQMAQTPNSSVLSLVLVQLAKFMGAAYRAREIWNPLSVKRTTMDSLGPLLYDRLSSVDPSVMATSDSAGWELVDQLITPYSSALRLQMPRQLIEAFDADSYTSILNIPRYIQNLRRSSTRAMSLVEVARSDRLLGHSAGGIYEDTIFVDVNDDTELTELIDYGSFPRWESSACLPIYSLLQLGPPPSNHRSHLSLRSELFHEVLSHKQTGQYKQSTSVVALDQTYVVEMMIQLSNSIFRFLPKAAKDLTPAEELYFDAINLLSLLVPLCVGSDRAGPTPEGIAQIPDAVKTAMDSLQMRVDQFGGDNMEQILCQLRSMHTITMFHDAAIASKLAMNWLLAYNDQEKERDRSGKSGFSKETVAQVKTLQSAADAALKHGKAVVAKLGEVVLRTDFREKFKQFALEDCDQSAAQFVTDGVVESLAGAWRLSMKGWKHVKWD